MYFVSREPNLVFERSDATQQPVQAWFEELILRSGGTPGALVPFIENVVIGVRARFTVPPQVVSVTRRLERSLLLQTDGSGPESCCAR